MVTLEQGPMKSFFNCPIGRKKFTNMIGKILLNLNGKKYKVIQVLTLPQ